MALHSGADELCGWLSGTAERLAPATTIPSYDLNKVLAAARGWQEKAATAPDQAAGEAYRRSAAQFERLVMRSLDTPAIC